MFCSKRILTKTVGVLASVMILSACNQGGRELSNPIYSDYEIPARVRVALKGENKKDRKFGNVEYHVDHINNRIFNSTPLPYGTKLDSAYLNMMVSSRVGVTIQNITTNKSTVWSSKGMDSVLVDVTGGKLRVTLQISDKVSKSYDLRIMSYGYDPNKLTWEKSTATMPKAFTDMKAISLGGHDYLMGRVGTSAVELYRVSSFEPLSLGPQAATMPAGLSPRSVVVTGGTAWGLTDTGDLYNSKDLKQWTAVSLGGVKCTMVLFEPLKGNVGGNQMVIIGEESGVYSFYVIDGASVTRGEVVPDGFPVRDAYVHDYVVSEVRKAVVLGGVTKEGASVANSFFTSDGIHWAPTPYSPAVVAVPMSGGLYLGSSDESRLFLIGGNYAPGASKSALKVSDDSALTWTELTKDNTLGETLSHRTNAAGVTKATPQGDVIYVLGGTMNGIPTAEVWKGWLDTSGGIINAF